MNGRGELAGDVVVERQQALDVGQRYRFRHPPQSSSVIVPVKRNGNGSSMPIAPSAIVTAAPYAVPSRPRAHFLSRDLTTRVDVVACVVEVHRRASRRRCTRREGNVVRARARDRTSTCPVMSEGRSGRFNHRARFSRLTSTAPAPCQPGTVVSSVKWPCDLAARSSQLQIGFELRRPGPSSDVSNDPSTAMFFSPRRTPDHSWKAKRSARTWRSSWVGRFSRYRCGRRA